MQKIAITGTKGKTTVVAVVADVLQHLGSPVLKVDTTGHFVNGKRCSTLEDSKETWGLVPTVCPGRYLWEFRHRADLQNGVAVLECAIGSSAVSGLGYRAHNVGVFLNVFEDHLGSSERLQTREDIAQAKSFIFSRLDTAGYAVFNADDELVTNKLTVIPKHLNTTLLPCGLTFDHFDIQSHLESGGSIITVNEQNVVLKDKSTTQILCDMRHIPWAFDGAYQPSVYNLMFAAATVLAHYGLQVTDSLREALEATRLDRHGGRLTLLEATNKALVIADYAHEKVSLSTIGKLARYKTGKGGKTIGVVRLAHDRTDELLRETAEIIAQSFDHVIIYDKIDGYLREPKNVRSARFPQVVGKTSRTIFDTASKKNPNCERIVREDLALQRAAELAGPHDVVVAIVNDNIEQSIRFIQKSFKAEFV